MSTRRIKAKAQAASPLVTAKRTFTYLKGSQKQLTIALILNILVTILTVYSMKLIGEVVDKYVVHYDEIHLREVVVFLLGLFTATSLFSYLETRITAHLLSLIHI